MNTSIVGKQFHPASWLVSHTTTDWKAILIREPGNRFDPNAIAVFAWPPQEFRRAHGIFTPEQVGYVPKAVAAVLAPRQDGLGTPSCGGRFTIPGEDMIEYDLPYTTVVINDGAVFADIDWFANGAEAQAWAEKQTKDTNLTYEITIHTGARQ